MNGLLRAWLRVAELLLPRDERERWGEEWRGDLAAMERSGKGALDRTLWALGLSWTVLVFRFQGDGMGTDGWIREVRTAVRGLVRKPGWTLIAVVTLGLGIGANTALFSVVSGVILEPLRYPEPGELVKISSAFPTMDFDEFWISPPEYLELGERARSLASLGGYRSVERTVGGGEQPERVEAAIATATFFDVMGVAPALGRTFTPEEDLPGAEPVAVLSWELWTRSFGGDRAVLGRTIDVNGQSTEVVGVMPRGFDIDDQRVELWLPTGIDPANRQNRGSHYLEVVGRLRDGVGLEAARSEITALVARWEEDSGGAFHVPNPETHPLNVGSLHEEVVGDVRPALLVLLGAVGFVLLIACANVGNLLLVRAEGRQREVAVRMALGAGRGRLLRQYITEGTVLSLAGAVLGVGLAWLSLKGLQAAGPGDLPRLAEIDLDGRVLAVTTAVSLAVGVFFGIAPARHGLVSGLATALRDGGVRSTDAGSRRGLRAALVASEMALALMLAVGAALMLRSFEALSTVDPGFEPEGLVAFQTYLPPAAYPGAPETSTFMSRLLAELEARPEVEAAALTSGLPPQQTLNANDTEFEGVERTPDGPPHNVDYYTTVSADYVETMGIEVVEGRNLRSSGGDGADGVPVVLVNRALADRFYPDGNVIGRRIRPCCGDTWYEVVGVVDDVKQEALDSPSGTELYFHEPQVGGRTWWVVLETRGSPEAAGRAAREVVSRLDPSLPVARLQSMERVIGDAVARNRFLTTLMTAFAALALLLAAVGTYGVVSYAVAQRSRELGIRMAMGAESGRLQRMVLGHGMKTAVVGLVVGLVGAWVLTGMLDSLLFEVNARDPVSFLAGPLLLGAVAAAACWLPARRATRVDPIRVLREE